MHPFTLAVIPLHLFPFIRVLTEFGHPVKFTEQEYKETF